MAETAAEPTPVLLPPDLAALLSEISRRRRVDPGEVVGEALAFFDAVAKASEEGGTVIVPPSGVIVSRFRQKVELPPMGTISASSPNSD